jgi:hypothetical protein
MACEIYEQAIYVKMKKNRNVFGEIAVSNTDDNVRGFIIIERDKKYG